MSEISERTFATDDGGSIYTITPKAKVRVVPDKEISQEEYLKELDEILQSIDAIKTKYYTLDASVERVRSRTFYQILQSCLTQLIKSIMSKLETQKI